MYAVPFQHKGLKANYFTTTWHYLRKVKLLPARERGGRLWWIPLDLFKWLLLYNRVVTNGQRLGISPGFYENVSFVVNKSYRIKERILGCRLDFICYTRPCHDQKCDTQELEVGWKSTSRPLLSPWTSSQASTRPRTGSQASFESQNWFQGLCLAPGMKEKDIPKRLGTTHKKRWSTWH